MISNSEIEAVKLNFATCHVSYITNNAWHDTHNDLAIALKYIQELESKQPEIKKLDWNIFLDGQLWEASALGGKYEVMESTVKEGDYFVQFFWGNSYVSVSDCVSVSDAFGVDEYQGMQLAQEHFEKIVRECLV